MKKIIFFASIWIALQSNGQLSNSLPPSGPVGIGTTTPTPGNQLTINGNTNLIGTINITNDGIIQGKALLNGIVKMSSLGSHLGDLSDLEILVIDPSGNVTRGTISGLFEAFMEPVGISCDGDVETPRWHSSVNKLFSPCPNVNVAIGHNAPQYKLDVQGTTYALTFKAGNKLAESDALISAFADNHGQDLFAVGKKIGTDEQEITFKIANDGTVYSREIRLRIPSSFPDYVFSKKYDLMSLIELKNYITKYHRLPNLPSAQEVSQNGLAIGEIQYKLVEKIEELTLYTIDLDEKNRKLEAENKEIMSELNALKTEVQEIKNSLKNK